MSNIVLAQNENYKVSEIVKKQIEIDFKDEKPIEKLQINISSSFSLSLWGKLKNNCKFSVSVYKNLIMISVKNDKNEEIARLVENLPYKDGF